MMVAFSSLRLNGLRVTGDNPKSAAWTLLSIATTTTIGWNLLKLCRKFLRWYLSPLRNNVPGPKCPFVFGVYFTIRKEPFMNPHLRWIEQFSGWDSPFLYYSMVFGKESLVVMDKEIVKEISTAPYGKAPLRFVKDVQFLRNTLGDGLVTAEGETWMRHRQILQPAFLTTVLKETLNAVVPPFTQRLAKCWRQAEGREIDLHSHLSSLTLDIIGEVGFSHEFKALDSLERWSKKVSDEEEIPDDPFIMAMARSFQPNYVNIIAFILGQPWISKYYSPSTSSTRKALHTAVDQVISDAKASLKCVDERKKSLLQLLLQAAEGEDEKKSLSHLELIDETKTFIFAGHETTSTWCYMAIYSLVTYPGIQEKVYEDVARHAPSSLDTPLDLATVEKMEYFGAFLQEVLRLHSPVGVISRSTANDEKLGGYHVPAKTRLVVPIYLLHRHPKYWDDPETFEPQRWLKQGQEKEDFQARIRFAFLPFSAGGRNCIGQRFATVETKLILSELIRSFAFDVAPSQKDVKFTYSNIIVMRTKPRLRVVVKSRC